MNSQPIPNPEPSVSGAPRDLGDGVDVVTSLRAVAMMLTVILALFFGTGCPTFEETYSGTFREVTEASTRTGDAVAVDFFRFGDSVSAILRFYQRDPITGDPFGEEKFCVWTDAQDFDTEQKKFRLYINKATNQVPRSQLFGTIVDEMALDITLYDESTNAPYDGIEQLRLERVREEPNIECETIDDFLVQVTFPRESGTGAPQAMPADTGYQIHNPVLAIAWVGVQPGGGGLAPVNRQTPAIPLDDGFGANFDPQRHALKNERRIPISVPPEIVRMPSGETSIALGHFVVIDDSEDDRPEDVQLRGWQFNWDTDTEKMVASSLRRATRPKCNENTDRWGPALLFVEDSLNDLSRNMQLQIVGAQDCEEEQSCDAHFYLVDVCAEGDQVLNIRMRGAPGRVPNVALFVSDEFLDYTSVPLPRFNPYQPWR